MLRFLARLGFLIGLALILLLVVGLPLRLWFGFPNVIYVIGGLYGVMVPIYAVALAFGVARHQYSVWIVPLGLISVVIPFAPFVFDQVVLEGYRREQETP